MNQRYTALGKVFMRYVIRPVTCLLMVLCVSLPASPFDSPLSDEAVREAYFLFCHSLDAFHPACGALRRVHRQLQRPEGSP